MTADRIPLPGSGGSLWLASRTDVAPDPDGVLGATGASTIVCLVERRELNGFPRYVEWLANEAGERAIWFPMANFGAHGFAAVEPVLDRVVERILADEGVIVHCAMGQGRAGTFAVSVLMMLGVERGPALDTVARHRRFAGPGGRTQWRLVDEVEAAVGSR